MRFYAVARRETSETKYEGAPRSTRPRRFAPNPRKKYFVVAYSTGNSPFINRFSTRRRASRFGGAGTISLDSLRTTTYSEVLHAQSILACRSSLWCGLPVRAPAFAESVTLFRVFLNDGTAIVSYGEYARVGDRVVFSMPIGAVDANAAADPSLHVVNLPVSAVNWTATEKYAESARHTHYMANSAESDYAALAGDVAATLNAIVLAKDAQARLTMAVDARRRLATWPRDHYGYRADDVARDARAA